MADKWTNKWNDRYQQEAFAYGTEPNAFLKEQLDKLEPGAILFGAEGEGRNAVYAATRGWEVSAFDISAEGRKKALRLAQANEVSIDYRVGLLPELPYPEKHFDAIALIYAHFPSDIKSEYHSLLDQKLKAGGFILFEAFGKGHLPYRRANPEVGGPSQPEALFSTEELKRDFPTYEILELSETVVELREGLYHNGKGSVVRFVGRKR